MNAESQKKYDDFVIKLTKQKTKVQKIEEKLKIESAKIKEIVINAECFNDVPFQDVREMVGFLYWACHVEKKSWMAEALGVGLHDINGMTKYKIHIECSSCKNKIYIEVSCFSSFNQYKNNNHICSDCEKKGKEEWRKESEKKQKEDNDRLQELKTMPYSEYLQSPEWKERRLRHLKTAKFKCQLCSKEGKLNVHHNNYENRGDELFRDLIALCEDCHAKHHDKLEN